MNLKKGILIGFAIIIGLTINSSSVFAADFRAPNDNTGGITINEGDNTKNLYTVGAMVTINGDTEKGMYVVGGTILINGDTGQTLNAVGGTIILRGDVKGTAHLAGGNIIIEGKITDDLIIGGGNVTISPSSSIGGDLVIGSGNVVLDAPVHGDIKIDSEQATINSTIEGSVEGTILNLSLGKNAEIKKNLKYKSYKKASLTRGAKILGKTTFTPITKTEVTNINNGLLFKILSVAFLIKLLIVITAGLVFVYLLPKITKPIVKESLSKKWSSLGFGFAGLILIPILALLLAITVIGLGLTGLLTATYIVLLVISKALAFIICGSLIIKLIRKHKNYLLRWQEVFVGAIILSLISIIPVIGWAILLFFILIAFGAIQKLVYKTFIKK